LGLGLSCTWLAAPCAAADTSLDDLKSRVEALEKQVGSKSPVVSSIANQQLSVLLQLQMIHDETPGVSDNFKGRRAEITLGGPILPDRVSYRVQIDLFLTGNITKDAFIKFSYVKDADFQFGQFKFPQGLEGRWSSGDLDFAERALVSSTFGDKRDYTAQIGNSEVPLGPVKIDYALALVNGAGQNNPDNNQHKDFAGRGGFQTGPIWIGASGYLGQEPSGERDRFGTEFRFVQGAWKIQTEYLYGITEPAALGLVGNSIPQEGYYILTNYKYQYVRPGIRWESTDLNKTIANNRQDWITLGLDIFPIETNTKNKITINYTIKKQEGQSMKNNLGIVQYQIAF
jgi:hypothetical protein